jgi:hypothetical protein
MGGLGGSALGALRFFADAKDWLITFYGRILLQNEFSK